MTQQYAFTVKRNGELGRVHVLRPGQWVTLCGLPVHEPASPDDGPKCHRCATLAVKEQRY